MPSGSRLRRCFRAFPSRLALFSEPSKRKALYLPQAPVVWLATDYTAHVHIQILFYRLIL